MPAPLPTDPELRALAARADAFLATMRRLQETTMPATNGTKPKRYYLLRTPKHRGLPFTEGAVYGNKRLAIRQAKRFAETWSEITPVRDRRISVYTVDPRKRPSLLYQCHADRKTGRIVSEVL